MDATTTGTTETVAARLAGLSAAVAAATRRLEAGETLDLGDLAAAVRDGLAALPSTADPAVAGSLMALLAEAQGLVEAATARHAATAAELRTLDRGRRAGRLYAVQGGR